MTALRRINLNPQLTRRPRASTAGLERGNIARNLECVCAVLGRQQQQQQHQTTRRNFKFTARGSQTEVQITLNHSLRNRASSRVDIVSSASPMCFD